MLYTCIVSILATRLTWPVVTLTLTDLAGCEYSQYTCYQIDLAGCDPDPD